VGELADVETGAINADPVAEGGVREDLSTVRDGEGGESRVVSLLTPRAMRLVIRRFGVKKIMNSLPMVSTKPVNMIAPGRGGGVTLIEMPRLEASFSDAQGLIFLDDLLEEERVAKTLTCSHHALKTASTNALGNNSRDHLTFMPK
jgi:hypothetical protein